MNGKGMVNKEAHLEGIVGFVALSSPFPLLSDKLATPATNSKQK